MPTKKARKAPQGQQITTIAEAIHADFQQISSEIAAVRADIQRNTLELDELRRSLHVLARAVLAQKEEEAESRDAWQEQQRVLFSLQNSRRAEPLRLGKEDGQ
ncbi:MAG TPA: hypothetical protein VFB60_11805 [Ktedonobacteraceae bacterium]|nr:hypothetical protein [Ktedonobacteraceae bacterium]